MKRENKKRKKKGKSNNVEVLNRWKHSTIIDMSVSGCVSDWVNEGETRSQKRFAKKNQE